MGNVGVGTSGQMAPASATGPGAETAAQFADIADIAPLTAADVTALRDRDLASGVAVLGADRLIAPARLPTGTTGAKGALQLGTSAGQAYDGAAGAVLAGKLLNASGVQQTLYTLGTPLRTWDIANLACDTKGGFDVLFHLIGGDVSAAQYLSLRVNGGTANLDFQLAFCTKTSAVSSQNTNGFALLTGGGDYSFIRITCRMPSSAQAVRLLEIATYTSAYSGGHPVWMGSAVYTAAGEITSVGMSIPAGGPEFAATSQCLVTRAVQLPLAG